MIFVTRRSQFWVIFGCAVIVLLVQPHLPEWRHQRMNRLNHFCQSVHPGMSLEQLVLLEKRAGIDRAYAYPYTTAEAFAHPENHAELVFVAPSLSDQATTCVIERNKVSITQATLTP